MNIARTILASFFFSCCLVPFSFADSNKDDIQNVLAASDWQVLWLDDFDQSESIEFDYNIAQATRCLEERSASKSHPSDCLEPLTRYFGDDFATMTTSIVASETGLKASEDEISIAILESLKTRSPVRLSDVEIHAGVAVYENWESVYYEKPTAQFRLVDMGFGIKTKIPEIRVEQFEQRIIIEPTYQPFIRARVKEDY